MTSKHLSRLASNPSPLRTNQKFISFPSAINLNKSQRCQNPMTLHGRQFGLIRRQIRTVRRRTVPGSPTTWPGSSVAVCPSTKPERHTGHRGPSRTAPYLSQILPPTLCFFFFVVYHEFSLARVRLVPPSCAFLSGSSAIERPPRPPWPFGAEAPQGRTSFAGSKVSLTLKN